MLILALSLKPGLPMAGSGADDDGVELGAAGFSACAPNEVSTAPHGAQERLEFFISLLYLVNCR